MNPSKTAGPAEDEPGAGPAEDEPGAGPPGVSQRSGEPQPFDLYGPLPAPGVTLLEASAGTGKTFTIAALVTRLVAEGVVPLPGILAVTFTRMATGELRERVRKSLVEAERALGRTGHSTAGPPPGRGVLSMLCRGTVADLELRHKRLVEALADFDSATITTTHGFCQLVLAGLGVAGEVADEAGFLEDPGDLVREVVDDLCIARVLEQGPMSFSRREALELARCAVANGRTPIAPAPEGTPAAARRAFAEAARDEVRRRLLDRNLLTYDDLLSRLASTLADPQRGEAACARVRERYAVVLVDEFQDTDPVQWEVVRRAFANPGTTLVLIGDPKQAIYAFRGADVHAYLEASELADRPGGRRCTLTENWRCDQALLDAYDAFFQPVNLGHPRIPYRKVAAAPSRGPTGISGAPVAAPLRVRVAHVRDHPALQRAVVKNSGGDIRKQVAIEWVAADLADDVALLLGSGAQLTGARRGVVRPGDVAVLVRTNEQARTVQRALRASGVAAVLAGADTVFSGGRGAPSPAALAWLHLLEALEQPASRSRAAAVALGPFMGMSAEQVAAASESEWERTHARLQSWAGTLRAHGVAALYRAMAAEGLASRVLRWEGGERQLTDLGHLAELLQTEGSANQASPSALGAWLARRTSEAREDDRAVDERSRRLESDAEAVQVLTIHRAKGLEFPVVYCPYLWDAGGLSRKSGPVVFHEQDRAALDLGPAEGNPDYEQHRSAEHSESRGEELRQLYVALTRAKHQVVIWWARARGCRDSPLGRLVMFRDGDGNVPPDGKYTPKDDAVHQRLEALARQAPGHITVERCGGHRGRQWAPPSGPEPPVLRAATFARSLDLHWRRTSYSAITLASHEAAEPAPGVSSEPDEPGTTDEPLAAPAGGPASGSGPGDRLRDLLCPLGDVPAGRSVGTLVHRVLEKADFAAEDLRRELTGAMAAQGPPRWLGDERSATLVQGLEAAISAPLGPLAPGLRLRDIGRADRLDELDFELPLAGGDHPVGEVLMPDLAQLWARHLGQEDLGQEGRGLAGYSGRLADPSLATGLRGYLTGSLDMVFRSQDAGGVQRFFVVDYKTNRLAGNEEPLSAWHYRPASLAAEMCRAHYPLQALFYLVALHRYLRWRLPGYSPDTNLAGALYLFVRGMLGAATPSVDGHPCGVFSWRPPTELIVELSELLSNGSSGGRGPR